METVIVTLKMPADLFSLVKKYAKGCIINEQFSNTSSITNRSVRNTTSLENQNVSKPALNDVVDEVKRTGSNVNPQRFYNYYEERNWRDKNGKPFDWKQMLAKWGTYGLEKAPSRNAPASCAFSNDNSFKDAVKELIGSEQKREVV